MMIRNATKKDIPEMMKLIHQAQSYFKRNHIDQWQDGYPNQQQLLNDILKKHSYVLDNGYIMGTMYFAVENDLTYEKIDGQWKTDHQSSSPPPMPGAWGTWIMPFSSMGSIPFMGNRKSSSGTKYSKYSH